MSEPSRDKMKSGLKQAVDGAKEELLRAKDEIGQHVDAAIQSLSNAASKVTSDEDVKKVVKGARSLAYRGIKKIADLLEDKPKPPGPDKDKPASS